MDSLVEWHFVEEDQACLVSVSDWPLRARIREHHRPYHDREILQAEPEIASLILATIDAQGPLSSQDFEDKTRFSDQNSWYGLTRTKRVLRSMWACGMLVTHHRKNGRHYYDRPERIIPSQHYNSQLLLSEEAYYRWIVARRYQAVGLLRPAAEQNIWSACGDSAIRKRATAHLVEEGTLTPISVGEKAWTYYMPTSALPLLASLPLKPRLIFVGPLDNILWDRKSVLHLFGFDYSWEVYKPAEQRRWGYYVLPVFYGNRFVARLDSRLDHGIWTISRWWWEPNILPDAALLDALHTATADFLHYLRAQNLRAQNVQIVDTVDKSTREAILSAAVVD